EIERAFIPARVPHATQLLFDLLKNAKQVERWKSRYQDGRRVEEFGLPFRSTHRPGLEKSTATRHVDGWMCFELAQPFRERARSITEIRPEPNERLRHGII